MSVKLKSYFTNWREIESQSNMDVINTIRKDGIHILIDLSGHSDKNRLPIFINKPAPVQVSWAGYAASTGIPEIDYIIGDPYVTPPESKSQFVENILCLNENIKQSFVYGDKKNYLVALIVPSKEFLNNKETINKTIEIVNKKLTLVEKIKKIQLIDENFSIENGLLTQTLKQKRKEIEKKYLLQIENMYENKFSKKI